MRIAKYYFYRNLHTKTFSVLHKQKVIQHPTTAIAHDCEFVVSEKQRQKVLRTKRKNVHAKVACVNFTTENLNYNILGEIRYNPYETEFFMFEGNFIHKAKHVLLKDNRVFLIQLI